MDKEGSDFNGTWNRNLANAKGQVLDFTLVVPRDGKADRLGLLRIPLRKGVFVDGITTSASMSSSLPWVQEARDVYAFGTSRTELSSHVCQHYVQQLRGCHA